jgi:hypothetical protein
VKTECIESADDDRPSYIKDAESAHIAAEYVRCILRKFPSMKSELRDLLWRIDDGEGVRIDSLDDPDTLRGLRGLLGSLNLQRSKTVRSHLLCGGASSSTPPPSGAVQLLAHSGCDFSAVAMQGTYSLRDGQDKILRRIGVVFGENIPDHRDKTLRLPGDPVTPPSSPPVHSPQATKPNKRSCSSDRDLECAAIDEAAQSQGSDEDHETMQVAKARKLGPAAAPEELLQAAAEVAAAMKREGLLDVVAEGLSSDLVGPAPPPELFEQLTDASTDVRETQVRRIMALQSGGKEAGIVQHPVSRHARTFSRYRLSKLSNAFSWQLLLGRLFILQFDPLPMVDDMLWLMHT